MTARKSTPTKKPAAKPKTTPTVAALKQQITAQDRLIAKMRVDLDTVVWLHAELMSGLRQAAILKQLQMMGPELARQIANGQMPQMAPPSPPVQFG